VFFCVAVETLTLNGIYVTQAQILTPISLRRLTLNRTFSKSASSKYDLRKCFCLRRRQSTCADRRVYSLTLPSVLSFRVSTLTRTPESVLSNSYGDVPMSPPTPRKAERIANLVRSGRPSVDHHPNQMRWPPQMWGCHKLCGDDEN
jgi:hypothetical protein